MLSRIRKFWPSSAGVAAVEFALILPILIAIMFFAIEASLNLWSRNAIQNFTFQAADIISREIDGEISVADIDDLFDNLDVTTADRMNRFSLQKAVVMYDFAVDPSCVNPFDVDEDCENIPTPLWYYNDGFGSIEICEPTVVDDNASVKLGEINRGYVSNAPVIAVFLNVEYQPIISSKFGVASDIAAYRFVSVRNGEVIERVGGGFEQCT